MKLETENLIRSLLKMDGTIPTEDVERAILIMKGAPIDNSDLVHVIRYAEAMRLLGLSRAGIDYLARKGHLTRVYGSGKTAYGITSDSYQRFVRRKIGPQARTAERGIAR